MILYNIFVTNSMVLKSKSIVLTSYTFNLNLRSLYVKVIS